MADSRSGGGWKLSAYSALVVLVLSARALAIVPDNPGPADLEFTIDSGESVRAISPYIYGSNSSLVTNRTADRLGGNRWTGYNWETNASNAGSDFQHYNDNLLVGFQSNTDPGEAVLPALEAAAANDRAVIVTVPMAGYVAADALGGSDPVGPEETAPSPRWKQVVAQKPSPLSLTPDESDGVVYTDEFVHWVENTKEPGQPVFYSLDNEPALWSETHPRIHPNKPTYTEMLTKTLDHAAAIKAVNPDAMVLGGVGYGWNEFRSLQDAPGWTDDPEHEDDDQGGELHYYEWLLQEVAEAEQTQGPLMDAIDLHWYPEARGLDDEGVSRRITFEANPTDDGVVAARVQATRSLWDPTYTETSWITGCCSGGPIKLLPHVQRDIDEFKPGTEITITEYNYGAADHISGGIAEADFLGVVGREGVFAANWWDLGGSASYVNAAFNMYLNYDGAGGQFGDTSVQAATDEIANSAVYASLDSSDPNRMVVVAINRTGAALDAAIQLTHDRVFDHAEIYRLTSASPNPVAGGNLELDLVNALVYSMPAYSVTTLVFISDGLPGDFNGNGIVDAADYTVWRDSFGLPGDLAADGNEDNMVNEEDFLLWRANFGRTELSGGGAGSATVVPEPATAALAIWCGVALVACRRGRR